MKRYSNNETVVKAYLNGADSGESGNVFFENGVIYSYGHHFPLAVNVDGFYICNGDRYSNTTSKHQSILFRAIPNAQRVEIPYSALCSMAQKRYSGALDIVRGIHVIAHETDRYIDTGKVSTVDGRALYEHVLGGCLFTWNGKYYVSSIDTSGTGNGLFFLTQIANDQIEQYGKPETISEALELLKPDEVKQAENFGVNVLRQGEWFFVETFISKDFLKNNPMIKGMKLAHKDGKIARHVASVGTVVETDDGRLQLVQGIVKHTGRDHKQLKLYDDVKNKKWFIAYESPQTASWSAAGNVD